MHIHADLYNVKPEARFDGTDAIWVNVMVNGEKVFWMGMSREEAERFAKALQDAADEALLAALTKAAG